MSDVFNYEGTTYYIEITSLCTIIESLFNVITC